MRLPQSIIDEFTAQAAAEYPHESCGFLIGRYGDGYAEALKYVKARNSMKENRERRFIIDPLEYQEVETQADTQGHSLIGIVHSHPDAPDRPSEFDRTHAFPGFSYVIISVEKASVKTYSSWRLTEDREKFVEEKIEVQP